MRGLVVSLDALATLRAAGGRDEPRLVVFAMAAELAGVDGVRVGVNESLHPVRETDLHDLRRIVRHLQLRLAPAPSLLKLALEVRPDHVLLAAEPLRGLFDAAPLEPSALRSQVLGAARALREAGIPVGVRIAPNLEAVKAARAAEVDGVELSARGVIDLPESERRAALEQFADAARLAAKLRLPIQAAGALDGRSLRALIEVVPILEGVVVGRELVARAVLMGVERAVRDLRAELG
ncbi:pyridoxine 5'-phosphate synthase [Myxococcota bacterium]|nr:pyridoxine 5'-phosphate synthase [Myxococcota bacterium]MCZ7619345.1 pyridoxine 5'-phosphate synthase [Myxococcota bacterium]